MRFRLHVTVVLNVGLFEGLIVCVSASLLFVSVKMIFDYFVGTEVWSSCCNAWFHCS